MKKLSAFLLLFTFCSTSFSLTLSDVRTQIRLNVRDTSSNASDRRYSDSTLNSLINESQREIINILWLSEKTTSYVLSSQTTYYNLPGDCINVYEVRFKKGGTSQWIHLDATSFESLKRTNPSWETISGTPNQYYIDQSTYSSAASSTSLLISYIPIATNLSTGTVMVRYYNQVDDLSSDTDIPFNAKKHLFPYHMALVNHVTTRIKAIEGRVDEASFYNSQFVNILSIMKDKIGRNPGYMPGMGVAPPR